MSSCGSMHDVVMHDNSSGVHVNSCGALGHKKLRVLPVWAIGARVCSGAREVGVRWRD